MLADLLYRLRALFRRDSAERDLDDELRSHIEHQTAKHVRAGLTPEEALRKTRIELGVVEQVKEDCRQSWGTALLTSLMQDTTYAVRVLRKSPGFTAAVALSLALGIGANTAIFSLIDAVMWRLLPVTSPESLYVVNQLQGSRAGGFDFQSFRTMREKSMYADLAGYSDVQLNPSVNSTMEPTVQGLMVSGEYFSLLGVNPSVGRAIGTEDNRTTNGHPVAMLSDGYWKRRFAGAPSVIGGSIRLSGLPFTIIGITPPDFFGTEVGSAPDIFLPMAMQPTVQPAMENLLDNPIVVRGWVQVLARLKPGVSTAQAAAVFQSMLRTPKGDEVRVRLGSAATGLSDLRQQFSKPLFILMAIAGMVLLIACANTANLLLARAAARKPEFSLRLALGANRPRLVRQLLVESVVLSALGGLCGIALARWATSLLLLYVSSGRTPVVLQLTPDLRVLAFTAAVSVLTGILFGLAPAIQAARDDQPGQRALSRFAFRPGKILTVVQIALSLLLLIGAGLFVRSLQNLGGNDATAGSVLIVRIEPKGSDQRGIPGTATRLHREYRDLIEHVSSMQGVRLASMGQVTPTRPVPNAGSRLKLPSGEILTFPMAMLYANYFATLGVPMAAGREFTSDDMDEASPSVCIINEAYARRVFPGENPLGKPCTLMRRQYNHITSLIRKKAKISPAAANNIESVTPEFKIERAKRVIKVVWVRSGGL